MHVISRNDKDAVDIVIFNGISSNLVSCDFLDFKLFGSSKLIYVCTHIQTQEPTCNISVHRNTMIFKYTDVEILSSINIYRGAEKLSA